MSQPDDQTLQPIVHDYALRAPALLLDVQALDVTDHASYVAMCNHKIAADAFLKKIKTITDRIKAAHKASLEAALEPWARITAPFEEARELAETRRNAYRRERERIERADSLRRLSESVERARVERDENVAALEEAHAATGDPQFRTAADTLKTSSLVVTPVQAGPPVPKVKGIRNTKTITITADKAALVLALGCMLLLEQEEVLIDPEGVEQLAGLLTPDDLGCLDVNVSWLKDKFRERKEAFSFPGVTVVHE